MSCFLRFIPSRRKDSSIIIRQFSVIAKVYPLFEYSYIKFLQFIWQRRTHVAVNIAHFHVKRCSLKSNVVQQGLPIWLDDKLNSLKSALCNYCILGIQVVTSGKIKSMILSIHSFLLALLAWKIRQELWCCNVLISIVLIGMLWQLELILNMCI